MKYGIQIADALDKAHRSGVVHRDLKPGNIMLTPTGAKLLDFGLAKPTPALVSGVTLTVAAPASPVTQEGVLVGTFQYMSPEQVEGKELDGRSDVFSLGSVLYEMVTGKRAFGGKSQLSVASAILEKEPEPISAIEPLTPPALDRALRRCLAKDPEERWQNARDLMHELKWIAEADSQTGRPAPGASHAKLRERLAWISAAVGSLVLGGLAGGWAVSHFRQPPADKQVIRFQVAPPESGSILGSGNPGGSFAISPDGQTAAFVAMVKGKTGLWVRPLDATNARLIPGSEGAIDPFWSPDSGSIAFSAGSVVQRVDLSRETTSKICDVAGVFRGGSWSSDGNILFATPPALSRVA